MNARYKSLDLWRGIACLLVVAYHSTMVCYHSDTTHDWAWPIAEVCVRGWVGVPIFFVISGYCIAAAAESASRKQLPVADYFWRRFRRIFPPYWAAVALTAITVVVMTALGIDGLVTGDIPHVASIPRPSELTRGQWLGNLTLAETWRPYVMGSSSLWLVGQAWTLAYEEQFYAVTGLLLLIAPKRFYLGVLAVSSAVLTTYFAGWYRFGLFWDGRWLLFAAGIGVYYCLVVGGAKSRVVMSALLMLAIVYSARDPAVLWAYDWYYTPPDGKEVFAAASFALLLIWLRPFDDRVANSRLVAPLMFCGHICYSLYLVHYLIVLTISRAMQQAGYGSPAATVLVTLPVCVAASICAGWLFHVGVERRFLNAPS